MVSPSRAALTGKGRATSMTDRDYEIAAEAAEAATTVRLKLDEIIGRVSTDSELVDVLHTAIATVKELERGRRDAAGFNDR